MLYNLNLGFKVEKDWWKKDVSQYLEQVSAFCMRCSAAIPFGDDKAYYGPTNLYTRKDYDRFSKDWKPWEFRDFKQNEPGKRIYE